MDMRKQVVPQAVAGIVAGLVVAGILWLFQGARDFSLWLFRAVWGVLTTRVDLPLGMVVAGIAVVATLIWWVSRASGSRNSPTVPEGPAWQPSALQRKVLEVFRTFDEQSIRPGELEFILAECSRLELWNAVEGLEREGLVEDRRGYVDVDRVLLTSRGREYLLSIGGVGTIPSSPPKPPEP